MPTTPLPSVCDVLVIGGGPAGLSAGVALARSLRSVLVVDAGQPRNAPAAGVHNYLGREGVSPVDLLADGRATLESYGGRVEPGEVTGLERRGQEALASWFRATLADGRTVDARRVVVATGAVDELPSVPGLAERWGRDVLHCPYCHGYEARGSAIGILSTSPATAHQALLFAQLSDDVTVLTHIGPVLADVDRARLQARGVRLVDGEVVEVLTEADRLVGVRLASGEAVALANLVIAAPLQARSGLLTALGVETADFVMGDAEMGAYAVADPMGATSVPGLFVAGNVSFLQSQVATSAAAGLATGSMVNASLITEEADHAVAQVRRTEEFWDERYEHNHHQEGSPNPALVELVSSGAGSGRVAGTALDLGSGRGDDALWLGERGWDVLGVDVAGAAVRRAGERAAAAGLDGRVRFEKHDLATSFPAGTFDLVTTHYLHSPTGLPRPQVLRRAAEAVAPGGTLLIVGHASLPPWAWKDLDSDQDGHTESGHDHRDLPSPEEVWAELDLDTEAWERVRVEVVLRPVTGPDDEHTHMDDSVVVARRRV